MEQHFEAISSILSGKVVPPIANALLRIAAQASFLYCTNDGPHQLIFVVGDVQRAYDHPNTAAFLRPLLAGLAHAIDIIKHPELKEKNHNSSPAIRTFFCYATASN